jgi:FKBP-type peptidyl-prolyl cis-trans isomerase
MLQKNGKKFDSSVDRGTPLDIDIGVGQVIKGWDEGIVGMKVGGKRTLYIPYDLAYGENGRPPVIPRKADLVFEVELMDVAGQIPVPEDAKKTTGGVQYSDTKVGTGAEATPGKKVEVHYTGKLQKNGKKFDSSVDRGETFSFGLGQREVIQGWDEGVAGMKEGGKRLLFIPSKLGYGERGAGRDIPPNSDLYFEVELIKVK